MTKPLPTDNIKKEKKVPNLREFDFTIQGIFCFDCRNNADNCFLNPIFDEIEELSYAKRYQNIFDQDIVEFVSSELLERQIKENFSNKTGALDFRTNVMKPEKALWITMKKSHKN